MGNVSDILLYILQPLKLSERAQLSLYQLLNLYNDSCAMTDGCAIMKAMKRTLAEVIQAD